MEKFGTLPRAVREDAPIMASPIGRHSGIRARARQAGREPQPAAGVGRRNHKEACLGNQSCSPSCTACKALLSLFVPKGSPEEVGEAPALKPFHEFWELRKGRRLQQGRPKPLRGTATHPLGPAGAAAPRPLRDPSKGV